MLKYLSFTLQALRRRADMHVQVCAYLCVSVRKRHAPAVHLSFSQSSPHMRADLPVQLSPPQPGRIPEEARRTPITGVCCQKHSTA